MIRPMNTTPPPPPPAPRPPASPSSRAPKRSLTHWWRQPFADLVDVVVVGVVAVAFGGAAVALFLRDASGDGWAEFGALLMGLAVGAVVGLVAWIAMLVAAAKGVRGPGARVSRVEAGRPLATAGRHLAVVVVTWTAAATIAAAVEPWPSGPLGGGLAAAVGSAVALAAWGRLDLRRAGRVVAVAALAGLALAAAVPDRAPYPWELRAEARAAMVVALEDDPTARRRCGPVAFGGGEHVVASHATDPCHDPDREWFVAATPRATAIGLEAAVREPLGREVVVATRTDRDVLEVLVEDAAVAIVAPRGPGCDSHVVLDSYAADVTGPANSSCL